jgi:hypothetical protein
LTAKVWPQRAQVPFVGLRGMGMSFGPKVGSVTWVLNAKA